MAKRQQEKQNTEIQIRAHITHSMNANTVKWSLCIARQLFRAQNYEHVQGCMNRFSAISDNSTVYLWQISDHFKIKSIRMKAKHIKYLSCK